MTLPTKLPTLPTGSSQNAPRSLLSQEETAARTLQRESIIRKHGGMTDAAAAELIEFLQNRVGLTAGKSARKRR